MNSDSDSGDDNRSHSSMVSRMPLDFDISDPCHREEFEVEPSRRHAAERRADLADSFTESIRSLRPFHSRRGANQRIAQSGFPLQFAMAAGDRKRDALSGLGILVGIVPAFASCAVTGTYSTSPVRGQIGRNGE